MAKREVGISNPSQTARAVPSLHNPRLQTSFIKDCLDQGVRELFCKQITSPNTKSKNTFDTIYGNQPFILMPPKDRWNTGIYLLKIAESLDKFGKICEIRNWYRPEPYNAAVNGAQSSQHLLAGAIDIEFCSSADKNKALMAALAMRQKSKTPPGVGVYPEGSRVIHIDMANRLYGPGIFNADRAAATPKWLNLVKEPGPIILRTSGAQIKQPKPQRTTDSNFLRHILQFLGVINSKAT